ncbi:MAG: 4'-phosphopantetheinyl transferase sfp [Firmicutes bacterium]|nr:4'-phosphopantetheinyl transferase sfp [Bacillota bacterium]
MSHVSQISIFHANISHTKGAMVCTVADLPVGVDIERVKTYNKRLVARFFTQAERNYVFADNENQDERFAEIWTKKEAYVKWQDKGMEIPFESFNVLGNTQISTLSYRDYCVAICTADSSIFKGLIDNLAEVAS